MATTFMTQGLFRCRSRVAGACLAFLVGGLVQLVANPARAQGYPDKPITFVVPFTAGAGPDTVVRALAREVGKEAGVAVVVENKPGAGAILAAQTVARAASDGYTVLITGNVAVTGNPHVVRKLPYDPVADFTPVTPVARGAMILYVNPAKVPATTIPELLQLLRKDDARYSYGYTSITSRLPAEVLQQSAGVKLLGVPYRSGMAALPDLVSGQIDMLFTDLSAWTYVTAGRLRALGVADSKRSALSPTLPTFEEGGVKGMDIGFWLAAYLPAHAKQEVVAKLHKWILQASHAPDVKTALNGAGMTNFTLPLGELVRFQAEETASWGRIIRAAGIAPD